MRRPESGYIIILLILALAAGLWLARTSLVEFALTRIMHNVGLQDITADIVQLDLNHARVSRYGFSQGNTSGQLVLESSGIDIDYTFGQLASGRIDSLVIDHVVVHYNPAPDTQTAAATTSLQPAEVIAAIQQGLQKYTFANRIRVHQLVLHGEPFGKLQDTPIEFDIRHDDGEIQATASLLAQELQAGDDVRQLVITELTAQSLAAELRFSTRPGQPAAELRIDFSDTQASGATISGAYHLRPQQLKYWLVPAEKTGATHINGEVDGRFNLDFKQADAFAFKLDVTTDGIAIDTNSAGKTTVHLSGNYSKTESVHRLQLDKNAYINIKELKIDTASYTLGKINLDGELVSSADTWNYDGRLSSKMLTLVLPSQTVGLKDLTTRILANTEQVSLNGSFAPANLPGLFSFEAKHNLAGAHGTLVIKPKTPVILDADSHKLSQVISPWPYPFDALAGTLQLSARAHWSQQKDFTLTTKIKLDDAGGNVGELLFSGLTFDHELEIQPALQSLRATQFDLKHIDSGITASNISTRLKLNTSGKQPLPRIEIQNLRGEILGGNFTADDFMYDLNADTNRLNIKATNIDLAKIVETQQLEDITVTGRIDGTVPVIINTQGVSIEHGAFINDVRAGTIRYNPAAGTEQLKQNPLTGITLDALRDFRYSELSAGVDFTPDGVLTIELKLKGTSPELDTKRPVHLNINTEQNLISLLKSLRYAKGVSDAIDAKVRRQYEKTRK